MRESKIAPVDDTEKGARRINEKNKQRNERKLREILGGHKCVSQANNKRGGTSIIVAVPNSVLHTRDSAQNWVRSQIKDYIDEQTRAGEVTHNNNMVGINSFEIKMLPD